MSPEGIVYHRRASRVCRCWVQRIRPFSGITPIVSFSSGNALRNVAVTRAICEDSSVLSRGRYPDLEQSFTELIIEIGAPWIYHGE